MVAAGREGRTFRARALRPGNGRGCVEPPELESSPPPVTAGRDVRRWCLPAPDPSFAGGSGTMMTDLQKSAFSKQSSCKSPPDFSPFPRKWWGDLQLQGPVWPFLCKSLSEISQRGTHWPSSPSFAGPFPLSFAGPDRRISASTVTDVPKTGTSGMK